MMHRLARDSLGRAACLLAFAALVCSGTGWASSRVALVVGNGGYAEANLPRLGNPVNDAGLMARALETAGFDVRLVTEADQAKMKAAIDAFGKQLVEAGQDSVGLFYYAGHGFEVREHNYLIPIGAQVESEVGFKTDAVPTEWVLSWMEAAGNRLNMVILDACRNNPYGGRYRGASQGLAQMEAPSGSLIAYAAAPGKKVLDGEEGAKNSPYTAALAKALVEPGLRVEDVFKRVRVAVEEATNREQTPWESSSLRGDFYFVAKVEEPRPPELLPPAVVETPSTELTVLQLAARAYEAAERMHTVSGYQLVKERFPGTFYAALAKEQIAKLESAPKPPTPPTLSAEEVEASSQLDREQRKQIQVGLWELGFNPGAPDGKFGERTRKNIRKWQASRGEPVTGYLTAAEAEALVQAGKAASSTKWLEEAREILAEAVRAARGEEDGYKRARAFADIAEAQAKAGDARGAAQSLSDARAAARGLESGSQRAKVFAKIAEVLITLAKDAPVASKPS